jgi:hypothetical protein
LVCAVWVQLKRPASRVLYNGCTDIATDPEVICHLRHCTFIALSIERRTQPPHPDRLHGFRPAGHLAAIHRATNDFALVRRLTFRDARGRNPTGFVVDETPRRRFAGAQDKQTCSREEFDEA